MWVLLESLQTKQQGKKIYFKGWTGTGPATTDNLQEAHRFESKEESRMSAAYHHNMNFFHFKEAGPMSRVRARPRLKSSETVKSVMTAGER